METNAEQGEISMDAYQAYMREIAEPMRRELTNYDFTELLEPSDVDQYMKDANDDTTTFVVINSVCGCAAGLARPAAVTVASQNPIKPDRLATVFAGQERPATETLRGYIDKPASSPSMALFKGQELVSFLGRSDIENRAIEDIMTDIKDAFDTHCAK